MNHDISKRITRRRVIFPFFFSYPLSIFIAIDPQCHVALLYKQQNKEWNWTTVYPIEVISRLLRYATEMNKSIHTRWEIIDTLNHLNFVKQSCAIIWLALF